MAQCSSCGESNSLMQTHLHNSQKRVHNQPMAHPTPDNNTSTTKKGTNIAPSQPTLNTTASGLGNQIDISA